jgi:hypothetical protein
MALAGREEPQIRTPYSAAVAPWGPWIGSHHEPTHVRPTSLINRRVRRTQAQEDTYLQRTRFLGAPQAWQRRVHAGPVSGGHLHHHVGQSAGRWCRCDTVQGSLREPKSSSSTETGKCFPVQVRQNGWDRVADTRGDLPLCTDCYTDTAASPPPPESRGPVDSGAWARARETVHIHGGTRYEARAQVVWTCRRHVYSGLSVVTALKWLYPLCIRKATEFDSLSGYRTSWQLSRDLLQSSGQALGCCQVCFLLVPFQFTVVTILQVEDAQFTQLKSVVK